MARASKGPNRARRKQGERTECRRRGAVAASASAAVAAAGCRVGVCRHVHKRGEAQLHRHQRRAGHAIEPDRLKHEPHRTQRQDGRWQPVCVDLPRRVERRPLDGRHVERHVAARHERSGGDPRLDAPGSRHTQRERCTCRRRWWEKQQPQTGQRRCGGGHAANRDAADGAQRAKRRRHETRPGLILAPRSHEDRCEQRRRIRRGCRTPRKKTPSGAQDGTP